MSNDVCTYGYPAVWRRHCAECRHNDDIAELEAENQRYRQALEFYAAESTYDVDHLDKHGYIVIDEDGGKRAREAINYAEAAT